MSQSPAPPDPQVPATPEAGHEFDAASRTYGLDRRGFLSLSAVTAAFMVTEGPQTLVNAVDEVMSGPQEEQIVALEQTGKEALTQARSAEMLPPRKPESLTTFDTNHQDALLWVNTTAIATNGGFFQYLNPGSQIGEESHLNVSGGQTLANSGIVKTTDTPEGRLTLYTQGGGYEIVDVAAVINPDAIEVLTGRFFDSRNGSSTPIAHGTTTVISGEPGSVQAVNLTVTGVAQPGWLQVLKEPGQNIGEWSNVNANVGEDTAAQVILEFNELGEAYLYNDGSYHILADRQAKFLEVLVNGELVDAFEDIDDDRAFDSRQANSPTGGLPVEGGSIIEIEGRPGEDAFVRFTTVNSQEWGFLSVLGPNGEQTGTSVVNYTNDGKVRGNGSPVRIPDDGKLKVFVHGTTDVIADIQGYFADDVLQAVSERPLDTRTALQDQAHVKFSNGDYIPLEEIQITSLVTSETPTEVVQGLHLQFQQLIPSPVPGTLPPGEAVDFEFYLDGQDPKSAPFLQSSGYSSEVGFLELMKFNFPNPATYDGRLTGELTIQNADTDIPGFPGFPQYDSILVVEVDLNSVPPS